ncbi:hypothetical protein CCY97_03475 [Helicobacter sp. 10-6591]|nr:hypothetical protein CCY97_03475 [Helicobacter sp. 10-6591]
MKMRKIFLFCFVGLLPSFTFGVGFNEGDNDFVQRLINFILFAAILWYFAYPHIKEILMTRKENIASRLDEVQNRLHIARQEKENALRKLEESRLTAQEIVETAKKEANLISDRFAKITQVSIESMEATMNANMDFENTLALRESVRVVLDDVLHSKDIVIDNRDYVEIITKRIS